MLAPGEVSLHAWRTVHSSLPNTSHHDRIGEPQPVDNAELWIRIRVRFPFWIRLRMQYAVLDPERKNYNKKPVLWIRIRMDPAISERAYK